MTSGRIVTFIHNSRKTRALVSEGGQAMQGAIYIDEPHKIVSEFIQKAVEHINGAKKGARVLVLGGGTYTLPAHIRKDIEVDVVEIVPMMHKMAMEYFDYRPSKNVNHLYQDARDFVAKTEVKYDIIVVDIFDDKEVPKYFRSAYFYKHLYKLTDYVIVNEFSVDGEKPQKFNYGPFDILQHVKIHKAFDAESYFTVLGRKPIKKG